MLEIEDVHVTYRVPGRSPVRALHGVDCVVGEGEVVGLLGPNGAGKTTLMRAALGMVRPAAGRVRVLGRDPVTARNQVLRSVGAILDGERELRPRWTVEEVLEFVGAAHGLPRARTRLRTTELLARLGFDDVRQRLVTQLSRGMRQKLSLALALLHEPTLLILDEPILGLDVTATAEFLEIVRGLSREGRGVLLSSHQLNTLEPVLDRVYLLRSGSAAFEGTPEELVTRVGSGRLKLRFDAHPERLLVACPELIVADHGWLVAENDAGGLARVFAAADGLGLRVVAVERMVDLEAAYLSVAAEEAGVAVPQD